MLPKNNLTFEVGDYVFILDGRDTKNGKLGEKRLRIITGLRDPESRLWPARTVEGEHSIGFYGPEENHPIYSIRKATEEEVKSYMPDSSYTGKQFWRE